MKKKEISKRVEELRKWMRSYQLDAFIFPSTDPHSGEYVPEHWKTREWISGFDGSAGTAVVTLHDAALWTDSRYFLAAAEQLEGTPFRLMKERLEETPTIAEWLNEVLGEGCTVGLDGWVNTGSEVRELQNELDAYGIEIVTDNDPAQDLWKNRPPLPEAEAEIQPLEYAGIEAKEKIGLLREKLQEAGVDGIVISQLDEVAWLTNLRGSDVHCNPVVVSYMLVTDTQAILYLDHAKATPQVEQYLKSQGIQRKEYDSLSEDLSHYDKDSILLDPDHSNFQLWLLLNPDVVVYEAPSPVASMKAVKNEVEVKGFRQAMLRDGVAMVKFLRWLLPAVQAGGETEMSVSDKLEYLRKAQAEYRDLSFDTIAGYGPHGAIVHYEATKDTDAELQAKGLLLIDSGAQYRDGTTDITRTIALGPLTEQECIDYTLVLRGHIRLAMVKFPEGTTGTQLDVCARYAMWQQGINYLHGTGHGVGSYLNVHEGPHQIRMNHVPTPLEAGMTVTNEPGIYRAGSHGIRTENTMLVTHYMEGEYGAFLQLEPLTLCPIDKTPILTDMMQEDEIEYLNWYHQRVEEALSPYLNTEEKVWLKEACAPIAK